MGPGETVWMGGLYSKLVVTDRRPPISFAAKHQVVR